MDEESTPNHGQLYNNTINSLDKYQFSIMSLLEAVKKIKYKDDHLNGTIHTNVNRIKRSILEIQTLQQKKIELNPDGKPLKNLVSYKINLQSETPKIMVEEDTPLPPWIKNL